jgi:hypothetical protein
MRHNYINPHEELLEDSPDIEIIINIECPFCKPEQEESFPEHYIIKDYPENYLAKQKPTESDIMFDPRIP